MKKNILGLDLGTTSIGFAHIIEGDTPEQSSIKKIGVRVNPLTTDEQTNFEKGKPVSINTDRTLKRGARRNLDWDKGIHNLHSPCQVSKFVVILFCKSTKNWIKRKRIIKYIQNHLSCIIIGFIVS